MNNHVWRPLYIAIAILLLAIAARVVIVPADFGIHERGYMYGWHRLSNVAEWKAVPVKYRTAAVCIPCHKDKYDDIKDSRHGTISCENCHGPNLDHPREPKKLKVDRSRALCLRCHTRLPYTGTLRGSMKGINPDTHHPQVECMLCHYPHNPKQPSPRQEVQR